MTEEKARYGVGVSAAQLFQGWAETYKRLSDGNCTPLLSGVFSGMAIMADMCAKEMRERDGLTVTDKLSPKDVQMTRELMRAALMVGEEKNNGH